MRSSERVALVLLLCCGMCLSGMWIGFPAVRAANTVIWTQLSLHEGDVVTLAIDPQTPATLYSGVWGGGVFRSTDSGDHWQQVTTGLADPYVHAVTIDPRSPMILYAGTTKGVFRSTDAGDRWTAVNNGLTTVYVYALTINPLVPATLYVGTGGGGVFRSTDRGDHWQPVITGLTKLWITCLAVDPVIATTVYAGTDGGGVFRSTDSGDHWVQISKGITDLSVRSLIINPQTPTTLCAGTVEKGIFRSTDGGKNWQPAASGPVGPSVLALAFDPMTPKTMYAGTSFRGVYQSTDGGSNWQQATNGIIDPMVFSVAVSSQTPPTSYAGARGGIFRYESAVQLPVMPPTPGTTTIVLAIGSTTATVNGTSVGLDVAPEILGGRTFVPIRFIAETFGADVKWLAEAQNITITLGDHVIGLQVGNPSSVVNGSVIPMEAAPYIKNSRTMVPLRLIAQAFGSDVVWDPIGRTVTITYTAS